MKDSQRKDTEGGTRRKQGLLIAAVVIVVVLIVAGVAIYLDQIAPFRTTVVSVGDSAVTMRTFIRRTHIAGREPLEMLQTLAREQMIGQVAPYPPYGIEVGEQDIDGYLRDVARGESATIDEKDFKEWYRQQINESRLPDREFRDLVRTNLLMLGLGEYLAERVPTVAEQVHLNMIPVKGLAAARLLKVRLDSGEDFAEVARESIADEGLKASAGDVGWHARGSLVSHIARTAFDELAVGEISEPLFIDEEIFAVVMVSERAAAREMDEAVRRRIQDRALDVWLDEEQKRHQIDFHGFKGAYDSETDAWVKWQLHRMRRQD